MEDVQFFPRSVSLEKEQNRGTFQDKVNEVEF